VKEDEMGGACSTYGEKRNANGLLEGKPEEKKPVAKPRCRLVDNIGMDLAEVGCGTTDLFGLPQDRNKWRPLVNALMNLHERLHGWWPLEQCSAP
jgi:hypothetical protein